MELPRHKKERREAWDEAEVRHALNVCDNEILSLCMYLAIACSLWIGEILALTWDCVKIDDELLQSGHAHINIAKELRRCNKESLAKLKDHGRDEVFFTFPEWKQTGSTTALVLKTPKTESSVRTVFVAETIADPLSQTKARQEALKDRIGDEYQDFNLVVAQDNGRPYEGKIIDKAFKAFIAKHQLRPVVFHSLRHSSTSFKLKISGGDIKSVQGDTGVTFVRMNWLMRGWVNYFGFGSLKGFLKGYGQWMRHKVRVVNLKQWKKPRTIYRNLQKLNRFGKCGFTDGDIFKVANSRLGWYRRCAGNVVNYALSPKILGQKTKDRPGLVDPLAYYLNRCT